MSKSICAIFNLCDLSSLYPVAMAQGVVAIVWDEVLRAIAAGEIEAEKQPSRAVRMQ